ncbi:MAG: RNA polymerase sigma-54 factor [Verrucomicrobia subdivision 3 bacterium]|nr:RNA polymerase sigma-54 factor [Limisphaerales bacterium]MCS1416901.1 RNA polymerase sigma-54 factor [Limisphaerales bacterium]
MAQGLYLSQKMALSQMLAPQLQQSLALLQAPILELQALVEQELQQNPILEEQTETIMDGKGKWDDTVESPDPTDEKGSGEPVDDWQKKVERLTQEDQEWREYFSQTSLPSRPNPDDEENRQSMLDSIVTPTSLQETLREQVRMSELPKEQWQVADLLIGNIDDRGYLKASIDELTFSTNMDPEVIRKVLEVIQSFDPPGVATRDLREHLMKQLERDDKTESLEYRILDQCFKQLSKRRMPEIARQMGVSVDEVQEAAERISHLNPRSGSSFSPENQQYVVPEVFVTKNDDEFVIATNNDHLPRLRISNTYKDLLSKAESSADLREYIREKIRSGKSLIKSINQRQQTISNIVTEIVKRQREFFEKGIAHLKPMTMTQIAKAVGIHETTVSRAVSGKYMQCPQGIFEMKYFFTSAIQTASGASVSNTTVKDLINDIVRNEDSTKPLSDEEIVKRLAKNEIVIARRTVAKYRSDLNILPAHLRKTY